MEMKEFFRIVLPSLSIAIHPEFPTALLTTFPVWEHLHKYACSCLANTCLFIISKLKSVAWNKPLS